MSVLATHGAVVAVVLATAAAAMLMLHQRRTPQSAIAWLVAFVALPYLALPLFLVLGLRRDRPIAPATALPPGDPGPPEGALDAGLRAGGIPAPTGGNRLSLHDERDAVEALDALISSAYRTLDAQFYLVDDDAVGRWFVGRLAERARAGVRVRLLIDAVGGWRAPRGALRALREAGGTVRWVLPVLAPPSFGRLNHRNHRKAVIADGRRAFTGGLNVGRPYMAQGGLPARWLDLGAVVEGPAATALEAIFEADWHAPRPAPPRGAPAAGGTAVVQVAPSGPDFDGDALHDALVHAVHAARRRVRLVTPYFVPTESLAAALAVAARRGVAVELIVPARSNHLLADLAGAPDLRFLRDAGVRVLRAPRMVHAKCGVLDDAAWLGSLNLDVRSLLLNRETVLALHDPESVAAVDAWIARLAARCDDRAPARRLPRRTAEAVVRLAAPIL